jgi:hypothetical protein
MKPAMPGEIAMLRRSSFILFGWRRNALMEQTSDQIPNSPVSLIVPAVFGAAAGAVGAMYYRASGLLAWLLFGWAAIAIVIVLRRAIRPAVVVRDEGIWFDRGPLGGSLFINPAEVEQVDKTGNALWFKMKCGKEFILALGSIARSRRKEAFRLIRTAIKRVRAELGWKRLAEGQYVASRARGGIIRTR